MRRKPYWDADRIMQERLYLRQVLMQSDKARALSRPLTAACLNEVIPVEDNVYRLYIPNGLDNDITVLCFGLDQVDEGIEGHYDNANALPVWMQERLALLLMIEPVPPISEVKGVGRRIDENVFWIYKPVL